jgi:hypothetical protein
MRRFLVMLSLVLALGPSLKAQAPLIDVSKAVAEFISDDEDPQFTIRGIFTEGPVDTMKAVIKTSTVRVVGGEYARYKPVFERIRWERVDSTRHEVFVDLHLEGKSLPLPPDSVRGSVRMTVSAAQWDGSEWLGTTSEPFSVPVINAPIPKPLLNTGSVKMRRLPAAGSPSGGSRFEITGITVGLPTRDTIERVPDVRTFTLLEPDADAERPAVVDTVRTEMDGSLMRVVIVGHIPPGDQRGRRSDDPLTVKLRLRSRILHGTRPGGYRVRTLTLTAQP